MSKKGFSLVFAVFFVALVNSAYGQSVRTVGLASSYPGFFQGQYTASGEVYAPEMFTASHGSLPFNTIIKVTNLRNNKTVEVKINDRFPFKTNRILDLSSIAAKEIDLFSDIAPYVKIEVIEWPSEEAKLAYLKAEGLL
jgi:rare lipoprotein A